MGKLKDVTGFLIVTISKEEIEEGNIEFACQPLKD